MNRRVFIGSAVAGAAALAVRRGHRSAGLGPVQYAWAGGVTPTAARVTVRAKNPSSAVTLVIDQNADFSDPVRSAPQPAVADTGAHLTFDVAKLTPKTTYHYGFEIEVDGQPQWVPAGRFRTFPAGAADFQIALASCAQTGSESAVFEAIAANNPDLFIHMGDFHYENVGDVAPARRRAAYAQVHASATQANLYRHVPVAYMWDDHDFLGNNTDASAPAAVVTDARLTYQQCVPHYPLALGAGDSVIGQAFTLGRVRFLMTDLRSAKLPGETMLGAAQKKWFKDEVRAAKASHPLIAWVSTVPWIGAANPSADYWAGYVEERRELADFFKAEGLAGRLCILSGDAHMLTIDDGAHSDYATGGGMPIPVFQAAALDQSPNDKGGPYTHPKSVRRGQFGLMRVRDAGTEIRVQWQGMNWADAAVPGIEHTFRVSG